MSWYTIPAFILTISILIVIHEYGHYRVAVACGVKVLRFSLGMGKPLWTWRRGKDQTEFVIAPFPFGGYVRMLDEREAAVDPSEAHRAFNRQPIFKRTLIVLAGPVANLILAVLLFAIVGFVGVQDYKPILAQPQQGSLLQQAGISSGDQITGVAIGSRDMRTVAIFSDFRRALVDATLSGQDAYLHVKPMAGEVFTARLPLSTLGGAAVNDKFLNHIGFAGINGQAVVAQVLEGGAAAQAGLQQGDVIKSVNGRPVLVDQVIAMIRASDGAEPLEFIVDRQGSQVSLQVLPQLVQNENNVQVRQIRVAFSMRPEMVTIRYTLLRSLVYGAEKTWEDATLLFRFIGSMLTGQASTENLSGPMTIAEYAGKTVSYSWLDYIGFLAAVSLSLGIFNLLPLPVLDGGHLCFFAYEAVRGKPMSDKAMAIFQYIGIFCLMLLMLVATYNDIFRLFLR